MILRFKMSILLVAAAFQTGCAVGQSPSGSDERSGTGGDAAGEGGNTADAAGTGGESSAAGAGGTSAAGGRSSSGGVSGSSTGATHAGGGSGSDGASTGGTSGSGGLGTGGSNPGAGGQGGSPPSGEWVNVTANLAGMSSECGNLSYVSAKPDEDMLIAAVAQHGLWTSTNGGQSWSELGTGTGSEDIPNIVQLVVYDPDHPATYWEAGIYHQPGVFRTADDGKTFHSLGTIWHNDTVSVDFTDPERKTLLAGGHERVQTVQRSTDGGQTWENVGANLPSGTNHSSYAYVVDSQTHLVGCSGWAGGITGIFRTTDGGQHWKLASDSGGAFSPLKHTDGSLYWASPNGAGMVRSTDEGATWQSDVGSGQVQSVSPVELPDGRVATLGPSGIVVSSDQGATWRVVTTTAFPYTAYGLTYSKFRKAFFVSHFTCDAAVANDAIMRYDFDYETQ